eukprot:4817878-Prymnesium_polylepis.1
MHDALEITARGLLAERSSGRPVCARFAPLCSPLPVHALRARPSFQACSNGPRLKRTDPVDGSCARVA